MKSQNKDPDLEKSYANSDIAYLLTPAAQCRYVLAAHSVRDCDHIVEIGGRFTPITQYLTKAPKSVLVLDPKMPAYSADSFFGRPCDIRHVTAKFQNWDFELSDKNYALVILGCSIKHFSDNDTQREHEWQKLIALINGAAITVLEYATDWRNGADNFAAMRDRINARKVLQIDMDISSNTDMDTPYTLRRFLVFESTAA
ncbi:MAG: hypothetical protein OER96_04620 [Gammaproteobacteria bacterium]|nr:hypothetical protein [Gammaproteobacteria bacterium]